MPKVVIQELENVLLWESLEEMSDRERHVLVRRYGMNSREPAILAELDAELDILDITRYITRSWVRQLQRKEERGLCQPQLRLAT